MKSKKVNKTPCSAPVMSSEPAHSNVATTDDVDALKPNPHKIASWLLGGIDPNQFYQPRHHADARSRVLVEGGQSCEVPFVCALSSASPCGDRCAVWSEQDMLEAAQRRDLSGHSLRLGMDIDMVRFDGKQRVSYAPPGTRVTKEAMVSGMGAGYSVRFLRPHEFSPRVRKILFALEEAFQCYCGANTYWTPSKEQGFAPHFDDVDVFVLQTEGEKEWFLYQQKECTETISGADTCSKMEWTCYPRYSSEDMLVEDLPPPAMHLILRAGEMLYIPRGVIHMARGTARTPHSLHITFSSNQMNTYADYLHTLFHAAVENLAHNCIELRQDLPHGILPALSIAQHIHSNVGVGTTRLLNDFVETVKIWCDRVQTHAVKKETLAKAMDAYAKKVLTLRQPVQPLEAPGKPDITPDGRSLLEGRIRVRVPGAVRLCLEAGESRLYYLNEDSEVPASEGAPPSQCLRLDPVYSTAIAQILTAYPSYVRVNRLLFPSPDEEDMNDEDVQENQVTVSQTLLHTGIFEFRHGVQTKRKRSPHQKQ